jgi:hypothetical protein
MKKIITKASFRGCAISDRQNFHHSNCIMPISVGQKVHEGEKFIATVHLINRYFQSCTLLIDDSIQRFTLAINEPNASMENLYKSALKTGDEWLERSKPLYELITIPYKNMRWDDYHTRPEFSTFYKSVVFLYNTDESYRNAIHENADDFVKRYSDRMENVNIDKQHAANCCVRYLQEECSVMCLWALDGYNFEVYPSGRNKAMIATYEKIIKPSFPNVLTSVSLRFKKY